MALSNTYDPATAVLALSEWYEFYSPVNVRPWLRKQTTVPTEALNDAETLMQKSYASYTSLEITGTPTLALNGRVLPKNGHESEFKFVRRESLKAQ